MASVPLSRRVQLVVLSTRLTPEELSSRLRMRPDAAVNRVEQSQASAADRSVEENAWELHEGGSNSSDITAMIESLVGRVLPITQQLKALTNEGCKVVLRVILYLSPNDSQGAGFVINRPLIDWLYSVGVEFVDVEQYVIE